MSPPPGGRRRPRIDSLTGVGEPEVRKQALEVIVRAFTNPAGMERHLRRSLWRGDIFDPEHTRVTIARGRVVSAVVMGPRMIRFGPVRIPAMTVGPVGTDDRHRKRGYGAAAMRDATRHMEENGRLIAYLQGIPDFYHRFGYYPYIASGNVKFDREGARRASNTGTLRRMTRRDLPRVSRIYNEATAGRTCAAVRDARLWDWLLSYGGGSWLFGNPRVILDGRARICGYLTGDRQGGISVREIVVRPDEHSCRAALGALVRAARRHRRITIWRF